MLKELVLQLLNLWYFLPIFVLISVLKSPTFKGWLGEYMVNLKLKSHFKPPQYSLFKNITLKTDDGTTQIDHILTSPFGIFVIETKNYKGWIFGSEKQSQWTQTIYKAKHKFQNPLRQNYKHTKTLATFLNLEHERLHSLIVFSGDAKFKTNMPDNVIKLADLADYIHKKSVVTLNQDTLERINSTIESGRLEPNRKTQKEHIQHVKEIIQNKEELCQRCGADLVKRIVKKGPNEGSEFWGCSTFPKCRYRRSEQQ